VPSGVSVKLPEARLAIILTTLFIDMVGIGIVLPILPGLVRELIGGSVSQASYVLGLPFALYALCQFFFAPLIGALSDRFGRRPIIVVALIGLGLDYLILAFAPNIGWLVFGRVMAGILGATYSAATAYIADISPHSDTSSGRRRPSFCRARPSSSGQCCSWAGSPSSSSPGLAATSQERDSWHRSGATDLVGR